MPRRTFDDLLEELEGSGWYQKRLLFLLLCPIFFLMPFAFLNQIFVLHIPSKKWQTKKWVDTFKLCSVDHWCTPPDNLSPDTLNMSLEQWKTTFLPVEIGPDFQPRPSKCFMYNVTDDNLPLFLSQELPGNNTDLPKVSCEALDGYTYDRR